MAGPARELHTQQLHYIRKKVNFNDAGISTGVVVGTIPANSILVYACAVITTAFNAATTNVLQLGTTATGGEILANAVVLAGATGYKTATSGTAFALVPAADTDIYASYTQTGTAATAGVGYLVLGYVPNNDQ
jgi:hypothetical protein